MQNILTTDRLVLRRWRPEDCEPFARINADPRVMEFLPSLLTREQSDQMIDRIEAHFAERGLGLYAVEFQQQFIGYTGLWIPTFQAPFRPCVEIGWRLSADHWDRGLATEAAKKVLFHALEATSPQNLVSFTVPENVRSRRVMEKIGMTHDPADDFDHPRFPEGHRLRRHVLYRFPRS
jgi:RimJ/RimL family protein N-acetyltransferase